MEGRTRKEVANFEDFVFLSASQITGRRMMTLLLMTNYILSSSQATSKFNRGMIKLSLSRSLRAKHHWEIQGKPSP